MSGSRVVIGEDYGVSNDDGHKDGAFEVYSFTDSTNTFLQRIGNPDVTGAVSNYNYGSRFGRFISTNEDGKIVCARPRGRGTSEPQTTEGNRALLVYSPNTAGTSWTLSKTLTRDTGSSSPTYYGTKIGRWYYNFQGSSYFHKMVDMNGNKIVLGMPSVASSTLSNDLSSVYGYGVGEMRIWESYEISSETSGSFRTLSNGSFNLRLQSVAGYVSTTLGGKKNL
jgi:hypothetical protein